MRRVVLVLVILIALAASACSAAAADPASSSAGCSAGQSLLAFAAILLPLFYMKRHAA